MHFQLENTRQNQVFRGIKFSQNFQFVDKLENKTVAHNVKRVKCQSTEFYKTTNEWFQKTAQKIDIKGDRDLLIKSFR